MLLHLFLSSIIRSIGLAKEFKVKMQKYSAIINIIFVSQKILSTTVTSTEYAKHILIGEGTVDKQTITEVLRIPLFIHNKNILFLFVKLS